MIKSYKLILIGVFAFTFCLFGFGFFYLQKSYEETTLQSGFFHFENNKSNNLNNNSIFKNVELQHSPEINNELPIKFIFRMRSTRILKPDIKKIPSTVKAQGEILINWTISNFLDFWYSGWEKYFYVTEKTLRKQITQQNYITYQPLKTSILMQRQQLIDLNDLTALKIDVRSINLSQQTIKQFLLFLQDEKNDWNAIKRKIIEVFPPSNVKNVTEKMYESIYFI